MALGGGLPLQWAAGLVNAALSVSEYGSQWDPNGAEPDYGGRWDPNG
ncbi:MAG TPA: hypothetical protein VF756_25780 [Thermoanaerobaculia bacterium]